MLQLSIFNQNKPEIPPVIKAALDNGAALAISVSGGKDSDAMLRKLVKLYRQYQWEGPIFAIFADLGSIEWPGTQEHINKLTNELGIELFVVSRSTGGMIGRWIER